MKLISKQITPRIGIWKIEESPADLLALLDRKEEYLPFLDRLKADTRQKEWLATRVLLKEMMGEEMRIAYRPDGAPYLPDSALYISISHTKGYAAVLLQEVPAAGIDIEQRANRVLKIRSRFVTPDEEAEIDPIHEVEHLLIHWCAKEALFKMIGQENVDFLEHLHIHPFPYAESGRFMASETLTSEAGSYSMAYSVAPDFVLVYSLPSL